jgi:hypothetical protein
MYLSDILQGVVSCVEKGSVIIWYKLPELIKKVRLGTPLSRSHVSSMTWAGSRTLLSRSHVSSMTSGCSYPIYQQGVVSLAKGSVIIQYQLPELIKIFLGRRTRFPVAMFLAWLGRGVEPCFPAAMFQAWQVGVLIRYTNSELSVLKKEVW